MVISYDGEKCENLYSPNIPRFRIQHPSASNTHLNAGVGIILAEGRSGVRIEMAEIHSWTQRLCRVEGVPTEIPR